MNALGPPSATVHRRPSASAVLIALPVAGVILGAILALAFGGGTSKPQAAAPAVAAPPPVAARDLRLTLPDGWNTIRKGVKLPGFSGAEPLFLRSWSADVAVALLPAHDPSLLPEGLEITSAGKPAKAHVVTAGRVKGYEYVGSAKDKRALEVVVVPTTKGVATIACVFEAVAPGECAQALEGLRVADGAILPLSQDAAFLSRLPAVTSSLGAERLRLRTRLTRAGLSVGAARTAYRLAGAYGTAWRALRPLVAPGSEARPTVVLLRRLRSRYFTLAAALRARNRHAFKVAAASIDTNEQRLAARIQAWQRALA
jgi:hypothetical protein